VAKLGTVSFAIRFDPMLTTKMNPRVFWGASAIIALLLLVAIVAPGESDRLFQSVQAWVIDTFGWLYIASVAAFVGLVLRNQSVLPLESSLTQWLNAGNNWLHRRRANTRDGSRRNIGASRQMMRPRYRAGRTGHAPLAVRAAGDVEPAARPAGPAGAAARGGVLFSPAPVPGLDPGLVAVLLQARFFYAVIAAVL
jgi:hypothetical protein